MDTMKFSRNLYPLAAKFSILYCSLFFEFFSHIDKISIQLDNQAIDKKSKEIIECPFWLDKVEKKDGIT